LNAFFHSPIIFKTKYLQNKTSPIHRDTRSTPFAVSSAMASFHNLKVQTPRRETPKRFRQIKAIVIWIKLYVATKGIN
jgi:hypothetical protein